MVRREGKAKSKWRRLLFAAATAVASAFALGVLLSLGRQEPRAACARNLEAIGCALWRCQLSRRAYPSGSTSAEIVRELIKAGYLKERSPASRLPVFVCPADEAALKAWRRTRRLSEETCSYTIDIDILRALLEGGPFAGRSLNVFPRVALAYDRAPHLEEGVPGRNVITFPRTFTSPEFEALNFEEAEWVREEKFEELRANREGLVRGLEHLENQFCQRILRKIWWAAKGYAILHGGRLPQGKPEEVATALIGLDLEEVQRAWLEQFRQQWARAGGEDLPEPVLSWLVELLEEEMPYFEPVGPGAFVWPLARDAYPPPGAETLKAENVSYEFVSGLRVSTDTGGLSSFFLSELRPSTDTGDLSSLEERRSDVIWAFDKAVGVHGQGRNVLFLHGRTEWLPEEEFQKRLAEQLRNQRVEMHQTEPEKDVGESAQADDTGAGREVE